MQLLQPPQSQWGSSQKWLATVATPAKTQLLPVVTIIYRWAGATLYELLCFPQK